MVIATVVLVCQGISGVLVRLTTCAKLTNSLPKLSLITSSSSSSRVVVVVVVVVVEVVVVVVVVVVVE